MFEDRHRESIVDESPNQQQPTPDQQKEVVEDQNDDDNFYDIDGNQVEDIQLPPPIEHKEPSPV